MNVYIVHLYFMLRNFLFSIMISGNFGDVTSEILCISLLNSVFADKVLASVNKKCQEYVYKKRWVQEYYVKK